MSAIDPLTEPVATLTHEEIRRYSRHLILPDVELEGQRRLKSASVLLVGVGGLGSPLAMYLAAAGIGRLGLIDHDVVDETNLQRQILHGTASVGQSKLDSAVARLRDLNPNVDVETHDSWLTSDNALEIFSSYDVICDGADNFPTRYLTNDACVLLGKPNVYGSIFRFEGQVSILWARHGPCYRCLFPEPPPPGMVPSCAEGGVLGLLPGVVGAMQATEAVKLILGVGEPMIGRMLLYDALSMSTHELRLRKDADCPICGDEPTITELIDYQQFCGMPGPGATPAAGDESLPEITPQDLKARLEDGESIFILDVREPAEWKISNLSHLGAVLIPKGQVADRLTELDRSREIVVHCHAGARSAEIVRLLQQHGFDKLWNLQGGILRWTREVETSLPTY